MRFLGGLVLSLISVVSAADERSTVVGFWASDTSIFEIQLVEDSLQGVVRALRNPNYLEEENTGRTGEPRTDDNNPDESLRTRPILGISMFSEYRFDDQWQGKIYDPESGNTYQSLMKINRDKNLEIRGYVGMPMFGRTAEFVPVSRCTEAIVAMLPQLEIESPCAAPQKP